MAEKLLWPTVDAVADILKDERLWITKHKQEDIDVRLQVYGPEHAGEWATVDGVTELRWAVRAGCSDYDQDHRGYWGASTVFATDSDDALLSTAEELLDQAKDHAAQNGLDVEG